MDMRERQRMHFNEIAERYHDARLHPNHQHLKRLIWDAALTDLSQLKNRHLKVMEAMCGFGEGHQILNTLSNRIDYHGFDYSDEVVSFLNKEKPECKVWQADVTKIELEEKIYDIIILIGGLHHVPFHAAESVRRLVPSLKPGGVFISLEPTHGNPITRKVRENIYHNNSLFDAETERAFGVNELCSLFESVGLKRTYISFPGLLSYVLYYNPDAFPALNRGGTWLVDLAFGLDRLFYRNFIGRWFSFATLSIWKR